MIDEYQAAHEREDLFVFRGFGALPLRDKVLFLLRRTPEGMTLEQIRQRISDLTTQLATKAAIWGHMRAFKDAEPAIVTWTDTRPAVFTLANIKDRPKVVNNG